MPITQKKSQVQKTSPKSNLPTGVKIISILYYIGASIAILLSLIFIVAGFGIGEAKSIGIGLDFAKSILLIIGVIIIGLGVLGIFIARSLWKAKKWARILVIIFSIIGIISAAYSMISNTFEDLSVITSNSINILINLWIAGYMLFSKKVKTAFGSPVLQTPTSQNPQLQNPQGTNIKNIPYNLPQKSNKKINP